jgi:hypothetical protein
MHSSIRDILSIVLLQIVFVAILAGAIYMGRKADARCTHPTIHKPVIPWAPVRSCTR